MRHSVTAQRALRVSAIIIASLAVLDPALSSDRRVKPVVAIIGGDVSPQRSASVAKALDDEFTLVDGPFSGADATVLLDVRASQAAALATGTHGPLIAVVPAATPPSARIASVRSPRVAPYLAPTSIGVMLDVTAGAGDSLVMELRDGGTLLDRKTIAVDRRRQFTTSLSYSSSTTGASTLTVAASFVGERTASGDSAHFAIETRDDRLRILVFDARASWMSTFVRRALEADQRFDVSSRTATSRNLSIAAGDAPSSLADASRIGEYDAIVVGAPDALSAASVAGLDSFLRERGGAVVLLFDAPVAGAIRDLIGNVTWRTSQSEVAMPVSMREPEGDVRDSTALPALRVSEAMIPSRLPAVATVIGSIPADGNAPVLFDVPVGAGRLTVSTAFDAWRYREQEQSRFAELWPALVASAASSSIEPFHLELSPPLARTGEHVAVSITARDIAFGARPVGNDEVRAAAHLTVSGTRVPLRLYPGTSPGTFRAEFQAPQDSGTYIVSASVSARGTTSSDSASLRVGTAPRRADRVSPELVASIARASGGAVIESSHLVDLARVIDDVAPGASQRIMWHPMRAPWWILPFAFLLGAEWWLRRRGGRA